MIVSDFRLKFSLWLSRNLPFLFSLLMGILSSFPIAVSLTSTIRPPLVMIPVFYFAVYTPDLLTPGKVFLLGILLDLMSFGPLGVETVPLVFLYALAMRQRRYLSTFPFVLLWGVFILFSAFFLLVKWGLACLALRALTPFIYDMAQWFFLIAFYPFMAAICSRIYLSGSDDLL